MCGFCGFYSNSHKKSKVLLLMNEIIKQRGPDDEGYWIDGNSHSSEGSMPKIKATYPLLNKELSVNLGMGFRRLAVQDLSEKGHQPMVSTLGNVLCFNGEIYNFKELREELIALEYRFYSDSDTEVLLAAYECWGTEAFVKLDGMFSLVLFDKKKDQLVFARDRFGLKPVFYTQTNEGIYWASEIKSLLKSGEIQPEISWKGLQSNFMFLKAVAPDTIYKNIFAIQPGHFAIFDIKSNFLAETSFYTIPKTAQPDSHTSDYITKLESLLKNSLQKQLLADVPVAEMLSGGIDSGLLGAFISEFNKDIKTFTLAYPFGQQEIENAKRMAAQYQLEHEVVEVSTKDLLNNLKTDLAHFEEPYAGIELLLNASQFAQKKHYTCVITGNGADELFGGYTHLQRWNRWKKIQKFSFLAGFIPNKGRFFKKIKYQLNQNSVYQFFQNGQGGMKLYELKDLFLQPLYLKKEKQEAKTYQDYFLLDMQISLGSHHAYRDDLSAMKHSVEFRYPFLNNALVDFIAQLPEKIRFNGKQNKILLRELAKKYVPKAILEMPKKGLSYPFFNWYQEDVALQIFIQEHLFSLKNRNLFNNQCITKWEKSIKTPQDLAKIWQLVSFEICLQVYFDLTK